MIHRRIASIITGAALVSLTLVAPVWAGTTFTGNYYLVNLNSGKALDVEGVSKSAGANVHQWDYVGGDNQRWQIVDAGGDAFFLKSLNSGLYLDDAWGATDNGANIQQAGFNGSNAQKFRIIEVSQGVYRLENVASGKVLDVDAWGQTNGANVQLWDWSGGENQEWKIIPVGAKTGLSGIYHIDSVYSGKSLDVVDRSSSTAANVQQWGYGKGANQQWKLINTGTGYYKIQSVNSGQMLDIARASTRNGGNLQQYTDNGNDAQLFAVIDRGNGEYSLRNKNSGKVLDVAGWNQSDGANIAQWTDYGNANQKWHLETVSGTENGNGGGSTTSSCGRNPVWSDEFNYSGLPDGNKWSFEVQGPGWVNNEWQNYTGNRLENARVENGHLVIEARDDWYQGQQISSARLKSQYKGDWLNGHIEVRAKLPRGRGTWPAIWMMPTDSAYGGWPSSGEIDMMENVGYDPDAIHGSVHTNARNFMLGNNFTSTTYDGSVQSSYHVYGLDWNQSRIQFLLDGNVYATYTNPGKGWTYWPFDKRFYMILNVAIGGDWGGAQGVDMNIFPTQMNVDWVRVYPSCN